MYPFNFIHKIIKNDKKKNGVKRLNQIGNQANHHSSEETPSAVIKSWAIRKHNRKKRSKNKKRPASCDNGLQHLYFR